MKLLIGLGTTVEEYSFMELHVAKNTFIKENYPAGNDDKPV